MNTPEVALWHFIQGATKGSSVDEIDRAIQMGGLDNIGVVNMVAVRLLARDGRFGGYAGPR